MTRTIKATVRQRLEALERGDNADAERLAIVDREIAKRCEELGIPESTEAEQAAFREAFDAAKPDNWLALSDTERADFLIGFILEHDIP